MQLRTKLLMSMLIPALLLGCMGAIGVSSLRRLERAAGRILSDNYRSIQQARRMSRALRLLEGSSAGAEAGGRPAAIADFDDALARCEANVTEPGEADTLRAIREEWTALRASVEAHPPGERATASLHASIDVLVSLNERAMMAYELDTRRVARGMLAAVTATAVTALLALGLFAVVLANRISRPITAAADRLHSALTSVPQVGRSGPRDEIARLRAESDALLQRLARYEDEQSRKLTHIQERLAFVINEILEGLVLMGANHTIIAANKVGRAILGMPSGEMLRFEDLDLREDVRSLLEPVMDGSFQPERDLGEFAFHVDGAERVFRPRVVTLPASGGSVEGLLILFWDVTEQRRFEESRRRFISMLSHQLKTPMTSLTMSVNLLREKLEGGGPAQAELLAIATENCASLAALVSDLIDAARETTPDLSLKPQPVDLVRLLRAALRPLVPQAVDKGVELLLPAEGVTVRARVDPVKFPWVVTNIVGNALRYTEPTGRITVAAHADVSGIEVSVTDTGTGIAEENVSRIFQPYVSLDREPSPGTHGLGLAIAKEIVEAHGGTIHASSEPGRGTTFVIRLGAERG